MYSIQSNTNVYTVNIKQQNFECLCKHYRYQYYERWPFFLLRCLRNDACFWALMSHSRWKIPGTLFYDTIKCHTSGAFRIIVSYPGASTNNTGTGIFLSTSLCLLSHYSVISGASTNNTGAGIFLSTSLCLNVIKASCAPLLLFDNLTLGPCLCWSWMLINCVISFLVLNCHVCNEKKCTIIGLTVKILCSFQWLIDSAAFPAFCGIDLPFGPIPSLECRISASYAPPR